MALIADETPEITSYPDLIREGAELSRSEQALVEMINGFIRCMPRDDLPPFPKWPCALAEIAAKRAEPWGDRRAQRVFIGTGRDPLPFRDFPKYKRLY